ncbi:class I SAM-dependent methyltransferase [Nocardiopsis ganjiahuensis]|uniref:class I SAM-dependent methyltransferase n=1 Tax=Nocardiopsis ganjiahuensis TaxID=239984 RepID=UPI00034A9102|nr:class I SAM-dependent methyltransferase [Nocardiopsis ganjiahuensis]
MVRMRGGSAGDTGQGAIARAYADHRQPEPRIAELVHAALGGARTVLNVGAGAGSYEPTDRAVTAVEPSASMRARRPGHLPPAVDATAESLPFADGSFDAAMTTFSVHQWSDPGRGLAEVRRVTTGPVAVLTRDPGLVRDFWLYEYCPKVLDTEARRHPALSALAEGLGGDTAVTRVPIPLECSDSFNEAYYGRPEVLLDRSVRQACSSWSFVDEPEHDRFQEQLSRDLADGSWDARYGGLRGLPEWEGSLVLLVSTPTSAPVSTA